MRNVGIVIVSHSSKVAEGAAEMVRQMVGDRVAVAWTGGNSVGGLGSSVPAISAAIEMAWSDAGVAVFVDLGSSELNSEMAVEVLDKTRRSRVAICNAPVVEGAVVAAAKAADGSTLRAVRRAAEALAVY